MALNFTDTEQTIREKLYKHVRENPGDTMETLLRGITGKDENTPMEDVFVALHENRDSITVKAFLGMQAGDMVGEIVPNQNTVKRLSTTLYDWLKSEPVKRTKSEIETKLFPGVVMERNPQGKADLEEAYRLVYVMPGISRFTKDGDKADKRWTTISYSAAKPAPLTPKS
jgi:hypothetical protein